MIVVKFVAFAEIYVYYELEVGFVNVQDLTAFAVKFVVAVG